MDKLYSRFLRVLFLLTAVSSASVYAQIPQTLNYQGQLRTATGQPVTATVGMTFCLYTTATGGSSLWCETHSSVAVDNGSFDVLLGSVNSLNDLPFDTQYYLGIKVSGDTEMTPRLALSSAPSAFKAEATTAGTTRTVDCANGDSINDALASRASTIIIKGVCTEDVSISNRDGVTLKADASAGPHGITGANASGTAININNSHNLTIQGLTIDGNASGGTGILLLGDSTVRIEGSTVENSGVTGITVLNEAGLTLTGQTAVKDNGAAGVYVASTGEAVIGEFGTASGDVVISGNNGPGLWLDHGFATLSSTTIQNNLSDRAVNVGNFSTLVLNNNNTISQSDNNTSGMDLGIAVMSSSLINYVYFAGLSNPSVINGPGGADDSAIRGWGQSSFQIWNMTINGSGSGNGIQMNDSSYGVAYGGTVTGGVVCVGTGALFYHNSGATVDSVTGTGCN